MRLLIYAGAISPLLLLQDVLKEAHTAVVDARAEEIGQREADGIPLDDHTRWPAVDGTIEELTAATTAMDTGRAVELTVKLNQLLSRKALTAIPAYEPTKTRDLVQVRFVALEDGARRDLLRKVAEAQDRIGLVPASDNAALMAAILERDEAVKDFIAASVCELHVGDDSIKGPPDAADLEAIKLSGLLWDLYSAARDYQELSLGKAERFGPRPQST